MSKIVEYFLATYFILLGVLVPGRRGKNNFSTIYLGF